MFGAALVTASEFNELRQELIDLRARVAPPMGACVIEGHGGHPAWECKRRDAVPPVAGGLRPCPVCGDVWIGLDLVECTSCAGSEDAAAKRQADQ